jgi:hypothetical protein
MLLRSRSHSQYRTLKIIKPLSNGTSRAASQELDNNSKIKYSEYQTSYDQIIASNESSQQCEL